MIGVLARGDLRQEAGSRQPLVDDGDRHVSDRDMVVTLWAGVLEAYVLPYEQIRRLIIELFAGVLAELLADHATAGAASLRFGKCVLGAHARQILGQLLAAALALTLLAVALLG